jgi:hypothetical protein
VLVSQKNYQEKGFGKLFFESSQCYRRGRLEVLGAIQGKLLFLALLMIYLHPMYDHVRIYVNRS